MEIPKRIKVGGHWYTVKYPHVYQERTDADGSVTYGNNTIFIGGDSVSGCKKPESIVAVNLIHELLHTIDMTYFNNLCFGEGEEKEQRVSVLSEALLQVLVDNGWLDLEATDAVQEG